MNDCPLTVTRQQVEDLSGFPQTASAGRRPIGRPHEEGRTIAFRYPGPASAYRAKSASADATSTRYRQRPSD